MMEEGIQLLSKASVTRTHSLRAMIDPIHFKTFLSFFCSIFISVYRLSCDVGNVSFIPNAALSHTQMLKVKLDKNTSVQETLQLQLFIFRLAIFRLASSMMEEGIQLLSKASVTCTHSLKK